MILSFISILLVRDKFCSKSELLSPPVAPVGSLHASRHQATVMEKEVGWVEGWERESKRENESEGRRERMQRPRPQEEITVLLKSEKQSR